MTKQKQIIILGILVVFLAGGLAFLLVAGKKPTRITPRAEEGPQATLSFVDASPDNSAHKSVNVVVTVTDPALNQPDGAGVGIVTSTISYSGAIDNLDSTPASINGWSISLTKANDAPRLTLFANQNKMDSASKPIKGTAVLGTIAFTLTGEQADFNFADDAFIADSSGNTLALTTEHLSIFPKPIQGATLKLVPDTAKVDAGDMLGVDLVLDTNDNGIGGVEAVIAYDKNLLTVSDKEQILIPENPSFGDYQRKIDLPTDDPAQGRLSVKALVPIPTDNSAQPEPLVGQNIVVARINFKTSAGLTGSAQVEYLCVGPPLPTGNSATSHECDPNPETEDFSLVSLFDATQPGYEGEGILTRVENGKYTITAPGVTPTVTPSVAPSPTAILSPTPTPTPTPLPTPTPTRIPTPTPTPQPGRAALRLALSACHAGEDNFARPVVIKIENNPQQEITMNSNGVTASFTIPSSRFVLKVMPEGHLPITFTVNPADIGADKIIDLTQTPFLGGNADNTTGSTGATDLTLTKVDFDDSNRNLDAQTINVSDYNFFKYDLDKTVAEHPEVIRSDFNCSGKVNTLDYSSLLLHWGQTGRQVDLSSK